ncbi:uncharacterized protein LOC108626916 [Ceratina calcarata]|uniref:Uncharacterized protein LOC108626916 n=1 Tax=Ceratina calcarata TaxID=156304 RepID=A0AAJ7N8U7_9HYME|nr:uncharacterized protein LOC108626916 [Ceratina calcarata]
MSQAYVHACERAELLGLPIPTEEEWKETQRIEAENRVNDDEDDAVLQNVDLADESAQRIGGGLDEINSILTVTQKKLNRFKTVCGSLSTLLKVRVGSKNSTPDHKPIEQNHNETKDVDPDTSANEESLAVELISDKEQVVSTESSSTTPKKIDLNEKMGSHINKLDALIAKAENAQYSMQHQTKQMKKFMK